MDNPTRAIIAHQIAALPESLRAPVKDYWDGFLANPAGFPWDSEAGRDCLRVLPKVWACSEFVARTCLAHPQVLADLVNSGDLFRAPRADEFDIKSGPEEWSRDGLPTEPRMHMAQAADEAELKRHLRILRRREMVRIAWRDLAGWADLAEVITSLSRLADFCIDTALSWLYRRVVEKHGRPLSAQNGEPVPMVVLGLGKLGGCELNFSSDVDLIFAYPEDGHTDGKHALSNHEFFVHLGRSLIDVLSEATADGFVFRVDMRLRPNGKSGPLALCFDAMEQYYQTHGREWERYALIKARVVAGDLATGESLLVLLRPFVYRRYLDYGAIEAIREMKAMIARELQRKGIQDNIKLGPGGIREIEFIGQTFQLIRGGRELNLQERGILRVLELLGRDGYLTSQTATDLSSAYGFLRKTENRLQMMGDRQIHQLPADSLDQLRLATAMGMQNWESFETALHHHMRGVHKHFNWLFVIPQDEQRQIDEQGLLGVWLDTLDKDTAHELLKECGFDQPEYVMGLLRGLREGTAYSAFSSEGRSRMDRLIPLLLRATRLAKDPDTTLARLIRLLEAIGRRSVYFSLLIENPMALSQLVKLCSASPWISNWIGRHLILLDELLDPRSLYAPSSRPELENEIRQRLMPIPDDDLEMQMEVLREFRHGHVLRVAAAVISGGFPPERVGGHLSRIAEVVLDQCFMLARDALEKRHGQPRCLRSGSGTDRLRSRGCNGDTVGNPGFAVIAFGKLGGLELGYASDLDMIFLYEACGNGGVTDGERSIANEEFFARLGQRLIHILTARTPGGILYEVDMRLRPSGKAGPLVTSLTAFREYQRNHAWTWEHQALVRARPVAGKPELCREFSEVRREILCLARDPGRLKHEVLEMRKKMTETHAGRSPAEFDVKHDPGGIVDIEFMVQYWVLRWAHEHPMLTRHTDNINILEALAGVGLLDAGRSRELADAYRRYLSIEHRLKLMERGSLIPRAELGDLPEGVRRMWDEVFGE